MSKDLTLDEFQTQAQETDNYNQQSTPQRLAMPFLGLIEDAGEISRIYKEIVRAGNIINPSQKDELKGKLGDILWFIANITEKADLKLSDIVESNLEFTQDRWHAKSRIDHGKLYDDAFPHDQQLPRKITIHFRKTQPDQKVVMFVKDVDGNEIPLGDKLDDNAYEEDGYRYHDVLHLAYYAILGWSPVMRALLKKKRKNDPQIDKVEDGARAILLEEAITAYVFQFAKKRGDLFEGVQEIDTNLLKTIRTVAYHLEVRNRSLRLWERSIIEGYRIFRMINTHNGGTVSIDLLERKIEYTQP